MVQGLHHIAIIASNEKSIEFYTSLGFKEIERIERGYDTIVMMDGSCVLEIYIDPTHPARVDKPEALGLRHLAFMVDNINVEWERLKKFNPEPIRLKENNKKVFFVKDPDGVPIEIRD